jgi:hypothetical protein
MVTFNGLNYIVARKGPVGIPGSSPDFIPINGPAGRMNTTNFNPLVSSGYVLGQLVVYNGLLYIVNKNNPFGIPDSSADYTLIAADALGISSPNGSFVPIYNPSLAPALSQGELIVDNDSLYRVARSSPVGEPGTSTDFTAISGAQGITGPAGLMGPTGPTGLMGPTGPFIIGNKSDFSVSILY